MAEPTYYVSVKESAAAANKRHLAVWNGHASVVLRVYDIRAAGAPVAAGTGLVIPLYAARITTAPTGGSAAVVEKADTENANVPASIQAIAFPTGGAAEGGLVGCAVVSGEETAFGCSDNVFAAPIDGSQPLVLRPGEGIVVRQGALASTVGNVTIVAKMGTA